MRACRSAILLICVQDISQSCSDRQFRSPAKLGTNFIRITSGPPLFPWPQPGGVRPYLGVDSCYLQQVLNKRSNTPLLSRTNVVNLTVSPFLQKHGVGA